MHFHNQKKIKNKKNKNFMVYSLKEGYLKMMPISEASIVRLTMPVRTADDDAIQPVANASGTK